MSKGEELISKLETKQIKLDAGLILQLILVLVLIIILVLSMFYSFLLPIAEIIAGIALIVMGYNNHRIYNRKALTWVYVIFGIILILSTGWNLING